MAKWLHDVILLSYRYFLDVNEKQLFTYPRCDQLNSLICISGKVEVMHSRLCFGIYLTKSRILQYQTLNKSILSCIILAGIIIQSLFCYGYIFSTMFYAIQHLTLDLQWGLQYIRGGVFDERVLHLLFTVILTITCNHTLR